jgi:hypothetical protein
MMHVSLSLNRYHDVATVHFATLIFVVSCTPLNSSRIKYKATEFPTCVPIKEAIENNGKLGSNALQVGTPNLIFIIFLLASEMGQAKQLCLICDNQRN